VAIDWSATGNWMQAWAGFAQAGAVVFVAYKGASAFDMWRRQKIEERRMDAAERSLTLAYRVRRALSSIRHPMMWAAELGSAAKVLVEKGADPKTMGNPAMGKRTQAQATLDRVGRFSAEWDEMAAITPIAAALFGSELELTLERLWRQRNVVTSAAEDYADDDGSDPKHSRNVRADLWEALGKHKDEDKVAAEITAAVADIEATLLPIIRADGKAISEPKR
jgi:hypothetical protein